ncbi:MAG TPA: TM2 domain-containing protein [Panacibacter sp.]|nr:TM2 domain-containing protein [Panacibacter sp.]
MKKIYLLFLSMSFVFAVYANNTGNSYMIDDQKVEQLFNSSTDVSMMADNNKLFTDQSVNNQMAANNSAHYAGGEKNFTTAILLDFFLGGLGIHRLYLGTKTFTWVGYILTCGGIGGIVPLVDFIVLIVHSTDISPYVDNSKFFMWSGQ